MAIERLQKILSRAGIASRRKAEELILQGHVTVNGRVVTELGTKADPERDYIKVDGKSIRLQPLVYLVLNKPKGYVTTLADPEGRPTVVDLLGGVKARVYPVGRLDFDAEGLLLLMNDGDLAHRLMHPRYEVPKTYRVKVQGVLEEKALAKLRKGVVLEEGRTAPARVLPIRKTETNSWIELTIREGWNRQVKRMCERAGHSVLKLQRVRYGPLDLGDLPRGRYRALSPREISLLRQAATPAGREGRGR